MKIQVNKNNVGLRIKQLRLDKGYTLKEFGVFFGTSDSIVLRWENGTSLPNKERIKAIAKFGDMSVNELLYGSLKEFCTEFITINYDELGINEIFYENSKEENINYILNFQILAKIKNAKLTINNLDEVTEFIKHTVSSMKFRDDTPLMHLDQLLASLSVEVEGINALYAHYHLDNNDKKELEDIIYNKLLIKLQKLMKIENKNPATIEKINLYNSILSTHYNFLNPVDIEFVVVDKFDDE